MLIDVSWLEFSMGITSGLNAKIPFLQINSSIIVIQKEFFFT